MRRTIAPILALGALFAATHSLLATDWVKGWVEARCGRRLRDGLYRFVYTNLSLLSVLGLIWSFARLPDRTIYRVPKPWSWLMRGGQIVSLGLLLDATWRMDPARFLGLSQVWELVSGKQPRREGPAQGPWLDDDRRRTGGAFRLSRHPGNLAPTLLAWLQPTMTVRWLTICGVGSLYTWLGSIHEERRVRTAYPLEYPAYAAQVPFFLPFPLSPAVRRPERAPVPGTSERHR